MSIAEKITALTTARDNIRTALTNKNINASSHGFSDFASDIANIVAGEIPTITPYNEPNVPYTPWSRSVSWPDLDQTTFVSGEEGVYLTYDLNTMNGNSFIGIKCIMSVNSNSYIVERGHLDNNYNFIADETYTQLSNSNFLQVLDSNNGSVQLWKVSAQNPIKSFEFIDSDTSLFTASISKRLQPCVEIKYNLPSLNTTSIPIYGFCTIWAQHVSGVIKGCKGSLFQQSCMLQSCNLTIIDASTFANMFNECTSLLDCNLNLIFTNNVTLTSLGYSFYKCYSLKNLNLLSNLDIDSITNTAYMFAQCSSLQSLDLSSFDTSNVTDMSYMFDSCYSLKTLNLGSKFNTVHITSMNRMFYCCYSLKTLDLGSKFDTSSVTNMGNMFYNCCSLQFLDLGSKFDTSSVTNMTQMFSYCYSLKTLNLGSKFDTKNVTNMTNMFYYCTSLQSLDLGSKFDTSNIISMSNMFSYCDSLKTLDLGSKFDTSNVTNMSAMFANCRSLESLDLGSKFDTNSVTSMNQMFYYCYSLKTLDLGSEFDTTNVTSMSNMFSYCCSLKTLNLGSKFDTSSVTNMTNMFSYCYSLKTLNLGSKFDTSSVTNMNQMFNYCYSLESLDLGSKFDTSSVTNMGNIFYNTYCLSYLNTNNMINNTTTAVALGSYCLHTYENPIIQSINTILSTCISLTRASLLAVLNSLPVVTSTKTLTLGSINKSKLTSTEIAIATQKGWTVT